MQRTNQRHVAVLGVTLEGWERQWRITIQAQAQRPWPETSAAANSAGAKFVHVCTAVLSYALIDLVYTLNS